jgi:hypothetical protein
LLGPKPRAMKSSDLYLATAAARQETLNNC